MKDVKSSTPFFPNQNAMPNAHPFFFFNPKLKLALNVN